MFGKFFRKKPRLDPEVERIFNKIDSILQDEETQNQILTEQVSAEVLRYPKTDQIAGGTGEFGRVITNPIPVNGPLGEVTYLSLLRCSNDMPVVFHRIASKNEVDCYEVISLDANVRELLWLDFHYKGKSRLAPRGYKLELRLEGSNVVYGTNQRVSDFPYGVYEGVRDFQERVFERAFLPTFTVRAFCDKRFEKIDWDKLNPAYRRFLTGNSR
jgi:hypothetical protein